MSSKLGGTPVIVVLGHLAHRAREESASTEPVSVIVGDGHLLHPHPGGLPTVDCLAALSVVLGLSSPEPGFRKRTPRPAKRWNASTRPKDSYLDGPPPRSS
jgi:hypothetical protein